MSKITLYKNHRNDIGYWEISLYENIITIKHAQSLTATPIEHIEVIYEGKQGRTVREQALHRIKSRINKQLDKGYVKTLKEASKAPTNAMDMYQPMLALPIKQVKNIDWNSVYVQPKLNGHRCLVTKHEGEMIAYSRQGKLITTIDHILKDLDLPEGVVLDGELYIHDTPLQTLASYAKCMQEGSLQLQYNIFDLIADEPFKHRWNLILEHVNNSNPNVITVPTYKYDSGVEALYEELKVIKKRGFEGLIVRHGDKGYEAGRRSRSLVKIKSVEEDDYTVVDVTPSKDEWGILHCQTAEGRVFKVSAPGSLDEKRLVYLFKEDYIGKTVNVEYSELTKDKIPFHPVATGFREDI